MAVNMSVLVYSPCQTVFGRPVVFTSLLGGSFEGPARGIYDSRTLSVVLEDNSIISDQQTILDIRTVEFPILPVQGDFVNIPYDPVSGLPALGDFEITDVWHNGGGEVTLPLKAARKYALLNSSRPPSIIVAVGHAAGVGAASGRR